MGFEAKALPNIGMEIVGIDAHAEIDAATARDLRALWMEAGLLLFRGLGTDAAALVRLSRCFGTPEPHPIEALRMPGQPELIVLSNEGGPRGPVYAFDGVPTYGRIPWHTDLAFNTVPNAGALLNMVRRADRGGRTAWLDTTRAYAAMDEGLKRRIDGLEARFEFCADLSGVRYRNPGGTRVGTSSASFPDYPPLARRLVFAHPETGRPVLNLCPLNLRGIVGMDEAAGDALIEALLDAVIRPEFAYEHDWAAGDAILWDNYRMMHRAEGHPLDVLRTAHRSTLHGEAVVGRVIAPTEGDAAAEQVAA